MTAKIVVYGQLVGNSLLDYDLRQGLPPLAKATVKDSALIESSNAGSSYFSFGQCVLSPDGNKAVAKATATNSTNTLFASYPNASDFSNVVYTNAIFSGQILGCACSNTHYAVFGTSPTFLYIFDFATHTLLNASTSGLGTVVGGSFSPDGTKLAICHTNSPFVRVYDIATLAVTNAPTNVALGQRASSSIEYSQDGTLLLGLSNTSPFLVAANTSNFSNFFTSTSLALSVQGGAIKSFIKRNRYKNKAFFVASGFFNLINARKKAYQIDFSTNPNGDIVDYIVGANQLNNPFSSTQTATNGSVADAYFIDYDRYTDTVYVSHSNVGSTIVPFTLSQFNATTGQRLTSPRLPNGFYPIYSSTGNTGNQISISISTDNVFRIYGTVRDINNTPVQRKVRAFLRSTGELMAETLSDSITGNYQLIVPDNARYDVQFYSQDNELLNDLTYSKTEPEPYTLL